MGFWIFMLLMDLLIPITMLFLGKYFAKKAPKEINAVFGYRTPRSMKNKETWEFAHNFCGKLWYICGLILIPISIIAMLLVLEKSEDTIGGVGSVLCGIQTVVLIGTIMPTEIALKNNFDENGNKR